MKKGIWLGFLVSGTTGLMVGCSNLPVLERAENQESRESINDGDGTEKENTFLLAERSVDGGDGGPGGGGGGGRIIRMHEVSSYSSFDAFGGGSASFNGDTIVVVSSSSGHRVWRNDDGQVRFDIGFYFSGLFVPENEMLTEEMEKLVNETLAVSGCQGLNSWEELDPVPGCEGGVIVNVLTGQPCFPEYERDPNLILAWQGDSNFEESQCIPPVDFPTFCDQFPPFYSHSNFSVKIYGGIITAVRTGMEENVWEDTTPQPEWWRPWSGQVIFEGVITADYIPDPNAYPPGCGGGRG